MGAEGVQVHYDAQIVLDGPIQGVGQELPGVIQAVALLVPELDLVYGQADVVKTKFFDPDHVLLLDVVCARLAPGLRLAQPMAYVYSAFYLKAVLGLRGRCHQHT